LYGYVIDKKNIDKYEIKIIERKDMGEILFNIFKYLELESQPKRLQIDKRNLY
jgi:hypothetical protein